jgi:hypothetical protein
MTDSVIARVVIACDAVCENLAGIDVAAQVASALNAALRGVFVQDEALLNWAGLPFARPVSAAGEASSLSAESDLLHAFEAHAARVRAALEAAAQARALGWSFDVVRGQASLSTLSIGERDLLVIEASSRPFAGSFRLESRWLAEVLAAPRPVLLVRSPRVGHDGVVALIQAAGASAERVIATAAALALAGDRRLTILLAGAAPEAGAVLDHLRSTAPALAPRCRIERVSLDETARAELAGPGAILVVDANPAVNDAAALKQLVARTGADILFLRA